MKLSRGLQSFWTLLSSYCIFAVAIALFNRWSMGASAGAITLLLEGIGLLALLAYIKSALVKGLPQEWKYRTHSKPDFIGLDPDQLWLYQQTSILESLGFKKLIDFELEGSSNPGLARLFIHPQQYCWVEVSQIRATSGEMSGEIITQTAISSILDEEWTISNVNRAPFSFEGISYIWRHPRKLRMFLPNISLAEMFENHLRFRQKMLTDLGITLSTDLSWNAYQEAQQRYLDHMKRSLQRKPLLVSMIEATQFELNPKSEWLGDYRKLL